MAMTICHLALAIVLIPIIHGFTFSLDQTSPEQCGTVIVSWQGGSPPFSLSIIVGHILNARS